MRVRQARGKLESSSSGCQTISLTSSACGQRSQSRGFEDRFLSSDRLASPSGASWFLASALLRFLSSPARFSSPTAVPPSSFEGHVSLRWLTLPHSAISSATTSLRTSWEQGEEPATSQRRVTCGELADLASQFTTNQGNVAQAIKTWQIWRDAFNKSGDPRQAAMARTFARELTELQEAIH